MDLSLTDKVHKPEQAIVEMRQTVKDERKRIFKQKVVEFLKDILKKCKCNCENK